MAINRNTTFAGLERRKSRVGSKIQAPDVRTIAADQAKVWEALTNVDAADLTGAPPTNVGHRHRLDQPGLGFWWPLCTQMFGDQKAYEHTNNGNWSVAPTVNNDTGTARDDNVLIHFWPIYIAPGSENLPHAFLLDVKDGTTPSARIRLETWSGTTATLVEEVGFTDAWTAGLQVARVSPSAGSIWVATFTPTSSGAQTLKLYVSANNNNDTTVFYGWTVIPWIYGLPYQVQGEPDSEWNDYVQVGNPDDSNKFIGIDENLTADDGPLDAALMLMANNDSLLQELAMDQIAAGNSAMTLTNGHNHDETGNNGQGINYCAGAWAFGTKAKHAQVAGNCCVSAPVVGTSTFQRVLDFDLETPAVAGYNGTPGMKFGITYYEDTAKPSRFEARISTDAGVTWVTYTGATPFTGRAYMTSATGHKFTNGGNTRVIVEIRDTLNYGTPGECALEGLVAWYAQ